MKNIISVIVCFALINFIVYALIECVDKESRIDERKRIAAGLTKNEKEMAGYIKYMEQLGRGKK